MIESYWVYLLQKKCNFSFWDWMNEFWILPLYISIPSHFRDKYLQIHYLLFIPLTDIVTSNYKNKYSTDEIIWLGLKMWLGLQLTIIFIRNYSVYYFLNWSINYLVCKMSVNGEKCQPQCPKVQGNVFKCLVLSWLTVHNGLHHGGLNKPEHIYTYEKLESVLPQNN